MPYRLHISEEEVREELRRLGHEDVPPHLVASFRKDLLKLIKSDIRRLKEKKNLQLSESAVTTATSTPISATDSTTSCSASQSNDHASRVTSTASDAQDSAPYWRGTRTTPLERAHSQPSLPGASYSSSFESSSQDATNTSIPSSALGLQRQIGRRARRARHRDVETAAAAPSAENSDSESGFSDRDDSQASSHVSHRSSSRASTSSGVSSATASTRDSEPSVEGRSRPLSGRAGERARRAPSLPCYPARTDPVSLYHYYKAHWDQRPPPGEDPRSSLRWKVRAQLFYSK